MWEDKVEARYWWVKIENSLDQLIHELSKAEDEEAAGLSLFKLHFDNKVDLQFFDPAEVDKIKKLLSILINNTVRHGELLADAIRQLEETKKGIQ